MNSMMNLRKSRCPLIHELITFNYTCIHTLYVVRYVSGCGYSSLILAITSTLTFTPRLILHSSLSAPYHTHHLYKWYKPTAHYLLIFLLISLLIVVKSLRMFRKIDTETFSSFDISLVYWSSERETVTTLSGLSEHYIEQQMNIGGTKIEVDTRNTSNNNYTAYYNIHVHLHYQ